MFTHNGEIILLQIDNIEIKQNINQLKGLYRRFSNLNTQWRDKIRITNLDRIGNFQSTIVLTNQRLLIFAPQSQKIMQFLNSPKPIAVKIFYEIYLSLITQIITISAVQQGQQQPDTQSGSGQKVVLKLVLYDNNTLYLTFQQAENQLIDFLRKSTDGRVHFIKHFIQTHIYEQKFIQTGQVEPLYGFQTLQRKTQLQITPTPVPLSNFYKVKILQNINDYSVTLNHDKQEQDKEKQSIKQLEPFVKAIQRDLQLNDIIFNTQDFILQPEPNDSKTDLILSTQNVNFQICMTYPPYYITSKGLESQVKGFAQTRFPVLATTNVYRCGRLTGDQKAVEDYLLESQYFSDQNSKDLQGSKKIYVVVTGESGFLRSSRTAVLDLKLSYREIYETMQYSLFTSLEQKGESALNALKCSAKLDALVRKYLLTAKLLLQLRKQGTVLICGSEERLVGPLLLFLVDFIAGDVQTPETFINYFDWHFAAFGYPIFGLFYSSLVPRVRKFFAPETLPEVLQSDLSLQFLFLALEEFSIQQTNNVTVSIRFGQKLLHEIYSFKVTRYLFDTEAERIASGVLGLVNNQIHTYDVVGQLPHILYKIKDCSD